MFNVTTFNELLTEEQKKFLNEFQGIVQTFKDRKALLEYINWSLPLKSKS